MASAKELGTYYVTVNARTDKLKREVNKSFREITKENERILSRGMSRALIKGAKLGKKGFLREFGTKKITKDLSRNLTKGIDKEVSKGLTRAIDRGIKGSGKGMGKVGRDSGRRYVAGFEGAQKGMTKASQSAGRAAGKAGGRSLSTSMAGTFGSSGGVFRKPSIGIAGSIVSTMSKALGSARLRGQFIGSMAQLLSAVSRDIGRAARGLGISLMKGLVKSLSKSAKSVTKVAHDLGKTLVKGMVNTISKSSKAFGRAAKSIGDMLVKGVGKVLSGGSKALTAAFSVAGKALGATAKVIGRTVGLALAGAINTAFKGSLKIASVLSTASKGAVSTLASTLRSGASRAGRGFTSALGVSLRAVGTLGASAGHAVINAASNVIAAGAAQIRRASMIAFGAVTVGAGAALHGGFTRLSAIEDATMKISSLGYTMKEVGEISDTILKSVQGTPFSLGEAAMVTTQLMATGVKPGKELADVLGSVANLATLAGTGMQDIGLVISQIAAKDQVYAEEVLQLAERGIPAYKILADSMGVTQKAAREMVSDGQVNFKMFSDAMRDNPMISGQAKNAAKTTTGAFRNLSTAWSRMGASFLEGFFTAAPGLLGKVTTGVDHLSGHAGTLGEIMARRLLPVMDRLADRFVRVAKDADVLLEKFFDFNDRIISAFKATPIYSALKALQRVFKAVIDVVPGLDNQLHITDTLLNVLYGVAKIIERVAFYAESMIRTFQPTEGVIRLFHRLNLVSFEFMTMTNEIVSALARFVNRTFQAVKSTGILQRLFNDIVYAVKSLRYSLPRAAHNFKLFSTAGYILKGVGIIIGDLLRRLVDGFDELTRSGKAIDFFTRVNEAARYFAESIAPQFVDKLFKFIGGIDDFARSAFGSVKSLISGFTLTPVKKIFSSIGDSLKDMGRSIASSVKSFGRQIAATEIFQVAFGALVKTITHFYKVVLPNVLDLITDLSREFVKVVRKTGVLDKTFRALNDVFLSVVSSLRIIFIQLDLMGSVAIILGGLADGIGSLASGVSNLLANNEGVHGFFRDLNSFATRFANTTVPVVVGGFLSLVEAVAGVSERTGAFRAAMGAVLDVIEGIADGLPKILQNFRILDIAALGITGISRIISDVAREIRTGLNDGVYGVFRDVFGGIEAITRHFSEVVAPNFIGSVKNLLGQITTSFRQFGIVNQIVAGVNSLIDTLIFRVPAAASRLRLIETATGFLGGLVGIVSGLTIEFGYLLDKLNANPPRLFHQLADGANHFSNVVAPQVVSTITYIVTKGIAVVDQYNIFGQLASGIRAAFDAVVGGFQRIDENIGIIQTLGSVLGVVSSAIKAIGDGIAYIAEKLKTSPQARENFERLRITIDHLAKHTIPRAIAVATRFATAIAGAVSGGVLMAFKSVVGFIDRMIVILPIAAKNFGLLQTLNSIANGIGLSFQAAERAFGDLAMHIATSPTISANMRAIGGTAGELFNRVIPEAIRTSTNAVRALLDEIFKLNTPQNAFRVMLDIVELLTVKIPEVATEIGLLETGALVLDGIVNVTDAIVKSMTKAVDRIKANPEVKKTIDDMNEVLSHMVKHTLPKLAKAFGDTFGKIIETILESDTIPNILGSIDTILAAIAKSIPVIRDDWKLFDSMINILEFASELMKGFGEVFKDVLEKATSNEWVEGGFKKFNEWTKGLNKDIIPSLIRKIKEIVDKVTDFFDRMSRNETVKDIWETIKTVWDSLYKLFTDKEFISDLKSTMRSILSGALDTIKTTAQALGPILKNITDFLDRHPNIAKGIGIALAAGFAVKTGSAIAGAVTPGGGGGSCGCGGGGGIGKALGLGGAGKALMNPGLIKGVGLTVGGIATFFGVSDLKQKVEKKLGLMPDDQPSMWDFKGTREYYKRKKEEKKNREWWENREDPGFTPIAASQGILGSRHGRGSQKVEVEVDVSPISASGSIPEGPTESVPEAQSGGIWGTIISQFGAIKPAISGVWNGTIWPFLSETIPEWFKGIKAFLPNIWDSISSKFGEIKNSISQKWTNNVGPFFTETIPNWFSSIGPRVSGIWDTVSTKFGEIKDNISQKWTNNVAPFFSETVPGWFSSVGPRLSGTWDTVSTKFGEIKDNVSQKWTDNVAPFFSETVPNWFSSVGPRLSGTWDTVSAKFGEIKDNVSEKWTSTISPFFTETVPNWFNGIGPRVSGMWNSVSEKFGGIKDNVSQKWNEKVKPFLTETVPGWLNGIGPRARGMWDSISENFGKIKGKISDKWKTTIKPFFTETIPGWFSNIKLGGIWGSLTEGLSSAFKTIKELMIKLINFLIDKVWNNGIRNMWEKAHNFAKWIPAPPEKMEPLAPDAFRNGGRVGLGRRTRRGLIKGPGTGTSDSILTTIDGLYPALLGNGERVLSTAQIRALGGHGEIDRLIRLAHRGDLTFRNGGVANIDRQVRGTYTSASVRPVKVTSLASVNAANRADNNAAVAIPAINIERMQTYSDAEAARELEKTQKRQMRSAALRSRR